VKKANMGFRSERLEAKPLGTAAGGGIGEGVT